MGCEKKRLTLDYVSNFNTDVVIQKGGIDKTSV